jgi:hypothetical protein
VFQRKRLAEAVETAPCVWGRTFKGQGSLGLHADPSKGQCLGAGHVDVET